MARHRVDVLAELPGDVVSGDPRRDVSLASFEGDTTDVLAAAVGISVLGVGTLARPGPGVDEVLLAGLGDDEVQVLGAGDVVGATDGVLAALGLAVFGFLVGLTAVLAHLAADALTPMGVRPFEPVDNREVCLDVARAANPLANYALLVVGVVTAAGALALAGVLVG